MATPLAAKTLIGLRRNPVPSVLGNDQVQGRYFLSYLLLLLGEGSLFRQRGIRLSRHVGTKTHMSDALVSFSATPVIDSFPATDLASQLGALQPEVPSCSERSNQHVAPS